MIGCIRPKRRFCILIPTHHGGVELELACSSAEDGLSQVRPSDALPGLHTARNRRFFHSHPPLTPSAAMTRMQPHIVITVMREDRANTVLAPGAHLPRKSESKLSVNTTKDHVVRSLPPPSLAWMPRTARVMPCHDVHRRLAERRKTLAASRPPAARLEQGFVVRLVHPSPRSQPLASLTSNPK